MRWVGMEEFEMVEKGDHEHKFGNLLHKDEFKDLLTWLAANLNKLKTNTVETLKELINVLFSPTYSFRF